MSEMATQALSQDDVEQMESDMRQLFLHGGTLGQVKGVTVQECEGLYQFGHGFYSQGRYQEAFRIFALLVSYDHLEPRFLMALAASAQMLGRYRDALQHYSTAGLLMIDDPAPFFYSAECCIALRNTEGATESLRLALEVAGDKPEHAQFRARTEALLAPLDALVH